jgi:hypothetical protein
MNPSAARHHFHFFTLGVRIQLRVWDQGEGCPSTQRHLSSFYYLVHS